MNKGNERKWEERPSHLALPLFLSWVWGASVSRVMVITLRRVVRR